MGVVDTIAVLIILYIFIYFIIWVGSLLKESFEGAGKVKKAFLIAGISSALLLIIGLISKKLLRIILFVGFTVGAVLLYRHIAKKIDEKIRKEEEEHDRNLMDFSQKLEELISELDVTEAKKLIEKAPENPALRTAVTRSEAFNIAKRHKQDIEGAMYEEIQNNQLNSAIEKADFLAYLGGSVYDRQISQLQNLCAFFRRKSVYPRNQNYGEFNIGRHDANAFLSDNAKNSLSMTLWALTLSEPFDLVRYKAFVTGTGILPTNNGNQCSIDMAASLLYLRHKYGQDDYITEHIGIDWEQTFFPIVRGFEAEKKRSLAEFAEQIGDSEVLRKFI